jgi:multidrug efflux pump subunit AcrA (membrane-fusion protein)
VLIRFDPQELEENIADLEAEEQLADLAIEKEKRDLPLYERSLRLQLEAAQRASRVVREDADRFATTERPVEEETADWLVKSARFWYEYYLEELRQLQKMYEADDLTEETEEVILKRTQFYVDRYKFYLKAAELDGDRLKQLSIPRQQEAHESARETAELALAQAENSLELGLSEKQYALDKSQHARSRARLKLARLKEDQELLVLRAPSSGTVYYGRCVNGKWSEIEGVAKKLLPGGTVAAHEVILTVVDTDDVYVRAEAPEKTLPDLRVGMDAPVTVPAIGPQPLQGRLVSLSAVPVAAGKFAAEVTLRSGRDQRSPVPGVACTVKPVLYAKKNALLAPATAVGRDPWTGDHFVMLVKGDGPPKKRSVVAGRKTDEQVEILEGLSVGDTILKNVE